MFFIISKLFWILAQPVSLILLAVLASMVLIWRGWRKTAIGLAGTAALLLFVLGYTTAGALLVQPLEARFSRPAAMPERVAAIVVLGGGTSSRISGARQVSELNMAGDRMTEALRLARAYPDAPVVFSGGGNALVSEDGSETEAATARRFFLEQGLPAARLVLEDAARNTAENAALLSGLLPEGEGAVLLVTSAYHMPRSMGLFDKAGIAMTPWPVDFRSTGEEGPGLDIGDPAVNLFTATLALREWLGLAAYYVTGRIDSPFPGPAAAR